MNTQGVPWSLLSGSSPPGESSQHEGIKDRERDRKRNLQVSMDFRDFTLTFSVSGLSSVAQNLLCFVLELDIPKDCYFFKINLPSQFRIGEKSTQNL